MSRVDESGIALGHKPPQRPQNAKPAYKKIRTCSQCNGAVAALPLFLSLLSADQVAGWMPSGETSWCPELWSTLRIRMNSAHTGVTHGHGTYNST